MVYKAFMPKRWAIVALLVLAASLCFTGCAKRQLMDVQDQVRQLQDFEREFKNENFELSGTINRNLGRLREMIEHLNKTLADMNAKLDALDEENRMLRGKLDELMHYQSRVAASSDTIGDMDEADKIPQFEAGGGYSLSEKLYRSAYNDFIKGNYDLAIVGFQDFIKQYSKSDMADNAHYWIGECYYTQGKYDHAISAFDTVIKDFPNGDKGAPATLKKGYSLLESGRINEGKAVLNGLIRSYPQSEEAKLAEERLKHTP
ncbi:tol-pal system protein YbgF [bacterium]|nr:tol-pal system protein YbgF [candidate division CSSED10-310 bacterium]